MNLFQTFTSTRTTFLGSFWVDHRNWSKEWLVTGMCDICGYEGYQGMLVKGYEVMRVWRYQDVTGMEVALGILYRYFCSKVCSGGSVCCGKYIRISFGIRYISKAGILRVTCMCKVKGYRFLSGVGIWKRYCGYALIGDIGGIVWFCSGYIVCQKRYYRVMYIHIRYCQAKKPKCVFLKLNSSLAIRINAEMCSDKPSLLYSKCGFSYRLQNL
jgi:hypothetical protein